MALEQELCHTHYGELLKGYVTRLFDLAGRWHEAYLSYKKERGLIDFNDMERLFLKLLQDRGMAEEIGREYKAVFVDEFQDSSPLQVRIFDRLSEIIDASYWVGDPKQSIYGFRGSDTALIDAVAKTVDGESENGSCRIETLGDSWRSKPELVALANYVFTRAFSHVAPERVKLTPKRTETPNLASLIHWSLEGATKDVRHGVLIARVRQLIETGTQVCDKRSGQLRALRPGDIAILTRSNAHRAEIVQEARRQGMNVADIQENVKDWAEMRLLEAIFRCLLNPYNMLARAEISLLASDVYPVEELIVDRLNWLALHPENAEGNGSTWLGDHPFLAHLDAVAPRLRTLPVPTLVEGVIVEMGLHSVIQGWSEAQRRERNLDQVVAWAQEYDDYSLRMGLGASLNGFMIYLKTAIPGKNRSSDDALTVLTYHGSKGLEWNAVILTDVEKDELNESDLLAKSFFGVSTQTIMRPEPGNLFPDRIIRVLPSVTGRSSLLSEMRDRIVEHPDFRRMCDQVNDEMKRLLYVGVTRARDILITTSPVRAKLSWFEHVGCPAVDWLAGDGEVDLWGCDCPVVCETISYDPTEDSAEERADASSGQRSALPITVDITPGEFRPRYLAPSALGSSGEAQTGHPYRIADRVRLQSADSNMIAVGNCLHHMLCLYGLEAEAMEVLFREIVARHDLAQTIPEPEQVVRAARELHLFLSCKFGVPSRIWREYPLQGMIDGQVLRGEIDLLWETDEGCMVVDYKSFPGRVEAVLDLAGDHSALRYAPQLSAYRQILERAGKTVLSTLIYYTIQGLIVPVEPVG